MASERQEQPPAARDLWARIASVGAAIVVAASAFLFALEKIYNNDIWWHLRTGNWILENGGVPAADPFSFTTPGAAWLPHYWLSDVVLALVHNGTGFDGLVVFKAAVVAAAFVFLYLAMRRSGAQPLLAGALLVLVVAVSRFRFLLRPQIFMFVLAGALLWVLARAATAKERPWRALIPAPLLLLAWVNMHASFVFALAVMGAWVADRFVAVMVARWRPKPDAALRRSQLVAAAGATALCTLVTLINPFFFDLWRWTTRLFGAAAVSRSFQIEEYRALAWGEHPLFWALMFATALSFVAAWRRIRVFDLLLAAFGAVLAVRSVRFVALGAMLMAPIIAYNLRGLVDWLGEKVAAKLSKLRAERRSLLRAAVGLPALVVLAAVLFSQAFSHAKVYRFGVGVDQARFPVAAVDFLQRVAPAGNTYNSWEVGGYLLYRRPRHRSFYDGRNLDAQVAFYPKLQRMSRPQLDALFARLDVRSALVGIRDRRFAGYFAQNPRFSLVYFDDQALLYVDLSAVAPARRAKLEPFKLIRPDRYGFAYLAAYRRGPLADRAEAELRRAVRLAPRAFKASFLLAVLLHARGRAAPALEQYTRAAKIRPRLAFIHYGVGVRGTALALRLRRFPAAVALARQAMRYKASDKLRFLLATALYQSGKPKQAERVYLELLRAHPKQASTLVNLGFLYIDQERFADATRVFERARRAAPKRADALYGLALVAQRSGQTGVAKKRWNAFLARYPKGRWAARARKHLRALGR